jgi:hypothetical protein
MGKMIYYKTTAWQNLSVVRLDIPEYRVTDLPAINKKECDKEK